MRRKTAVGLALGGAGVVGVVSVAASGGFGFGSAGAEIAGDVAVASSETVVALGLLVSITAAFAVGAMLGRIRSAVRDRSDEPGSASATERAEGVEAEPESGNAHPGRSDGGVTVTDPDSHVDADADVPELLSDEEHVVRLLEANGGQLGQSEIVALTPWSKSKVSRLLARMDDRDEVVKVSTGRNNVIFVPGEEPAGLKPPEKPESGE